MAEVDLDELELEGLEWNHGQLFRAALKLSAERGILFSAPMVLALLAGRKTVTRRMSAQWDSLQVGQRLWVRETHALEIIKDDPNRGSDTRLVLRADRAARWVCGPSAELFWLDSNHEPERWIPAIHMPRWASRILLEVTEPVRVERAWDITDEEAYLEGIEELDGSLDERELCRVAKEMGGCPEDARVWFATLWQQINNKPPKPGKPDGRWSANPTVRRIAFKRIE
jgi:hypothetical protein